MDIVESFLLNKRRGKNEGTSRRGRDEVLSNDHFRFLCLGEKPKVNKRKKYAWIYYLCQWCFFFRRKQFLQQQESYVDIKTNAALNYVKHIEFTLKEKQYRSSKLHPTGIQICFQSVLHTFFLVADKIHVPEALQESFDGVRKFCSALT